MPHRTHRFLGVLAAFLLAAILSGCTLSMAGDAPLPTPIPTNYLPTVIALTSQALASPTPPVTATPLPPTPTATPAVTFTPSPSPIVLPTITPTPPPPLDTPGRGYAVLQILYPGMDSHVTSPLHAQLAFQTRYTDTVRVELLGEDGRLIYRKIIRLGDEQPPHSLIHRNLEIPFELRAEAETGRLQVSAQDEFGRPLAQNAIFLTLLRTGDEQINYRIADHAPILFQSPKPYQIIQGGEIVVIGKALPTGATMVEAKLIDERGKVLAYQTAPLSTPSADGYARFTMTIPYTLDKVTRVRLVVQENGITPPGVAYLDSIPLTLGP